MFLDQLNSAGALPALEATIRFSGQRQTLLAHNVANLETPGFRPADVSPFHFQRALREAVERRRAAGQAASGPLSMKDTRQIRQGADGSIELRPLTASGNVLFHDRNNRDLERTMQDMVENQAMFRVATDLLRSRVGVLREAISERVG